RRAPPPAPRAPSGRSTCPAPPPRRPPAARSCRRDPSSATQCRPTPTSQPERAAPPRRAASVRVAAGLGVVVGERDLARVVRRFLAQDERARRDDAAAIGDGQHVLLVALDVFLVEDHRVEEHALALLHELLGLHLL